MSLRSLEIDPKQHRSGLEKMSCTFTAIVCHSARVIDPTEKEPKQSEWGVLLCNEDNKIYLLFKMSNKDGNSETKKGDDEICTFLAKTEK